DHVRRVRSGLGRLEHALRRLVGGREEDVGAVRDERLRRRLGERRVVPAVDVLLLERHLRVDAAGAERERLRLARERREGVAVHGRDLVRLRDQTGERTGEEGTLLLLGVDVTEVRRLVSRLLRRRRRELERRLDELRLREVLCGLQVGLADAAVRDDDEVVALRAERGRLREVLIRCVQVADERHLHAVLLRGRGGTLGPCLPPRAVVRGAGKQDRDLVGRRARARCGRGGDRADEHAAEHADEKGSEAWHYVP